MGSYYGASFITFWSKWFCEEKYAWSCRWWNCVWQECSILPNWPHYPLKETFFNPAACQRTRWGRSSPPSWSSTPTARSTRGSSRRCSKRWEVWWFCWFLHSCPVLKHWGFLVIYLCSDAAWTRRNLHAEAHLPMLRREREWLHWLCRVHGSISTGSTKTWFPYYILAGLPHHVRWHSRGGVEEDFPCVWREQRRAHHREGAEEARQGHVQAGQGRGSGGGEWKASNIGICNDLSSNGFFQATKKFLIESAFAEMDKDENGKVSGIFFKYHAFYVWSCLVFLMLRQRS